MEQQPRFKEPEELPDLRRPTEKEMQEDPGWARINDIKKGKELPGWDDEQKDFVRAWTDEDFDMVKQLIINVEAELIDHDEVKSQVRRGRHWPPTDWDDDWYLDKYWPTKDSWLRMIQIWKRALWSKFVGVMSIDLNGFIVGVTDRVVSLRTRGGPGDVCSFLHGVLQRHV